MTKEHEWQEALATVDVSALESLKRLKQEQDLIDERLRAMSALKDSVAVTVYQRVFEDYQKRRQQLESEAAPQKHKVRAEFAKLHDLLANFEAAHETSKLDQQELELRYKLGEFNETEYAKRSDAIETLVADKLAAYERALALKTRFLEAFHSEEELLARTPEGVITERQLPALTGNELTQAEAHTDEVRAIPMAASSKTQVMPAIKLVKETNAPTAGNQGTVMFRAARLVPQNAEAGKATFTLSLKPTVIGADAASDVRIAGPGVDPKHAQITVSMAGFTLIDCGSKHGTRVNAEKIRERLLRHEDVIQIGAARFVFREG